MEQIAESLDGRHGLPEGITFSKKLSKLHQIIATRTHEKASDLVKKSARAFAGA